MKSERIRIAVIGMSKRGASLTGLLAKMPDVDILAVCDKYPDRVENGRKVVSEAGKAMPAGFTDYREALKVPGLQAVMVTSSWQSHASICLDAMRAGLYTASEVGGAYSVQQCWDIVHTSEATGMPFMLLENCCYGRDELAVLHMARLGLFGELVHAEGGYHHDLRKEIDMGVENRHYRLANFSHRNGDLYPTHDLGPIAKCLGINRGNRMLYLTSTASKAVGLNDWARQHRGEHDALASRHFAEGDVVTTTIKCARGETIVLTHDCSLHRPYSRGNLLQGTRGIWQEDKHAVSIEGITPRRDGHWDPETWVEIDKLYKKYDHPLWRKYLALGVKAGHGGMDYLVLRAFLTAVRDGVQTPIDVYDSAAWMAITALSEESVAMGSHPVAIPDFTNGAWIDERPFVPGPFCLDEDKPVRGSI